MKDRKSGQISIFFQGQISHSIANQMTDGNISKDAQRIMGIFVIAEVAFPMNQKKRKMRQRDYFSTYLR